MTLQSHEISTSIEIDTGCGREIQRAIEKYTSYLRYEHEGISQSWWKLGIISEAKVAFPYTAKVITEVRPDRGVALLRPMARRLPKI